MGSRWSRTGLRVGWVLPGLLQEEVDPVWTLDLQNTIQRVEPFLGLDWIKVATALHRHLPGETHQTRAHESIGSLTRGCDK